MDETNIDEFESEDNEEVVTVHNKLPWYKITIFAMYVFSETLQNSLPGVLENIRGKCSICNHQISGRRTANTNFLRHFVCIRFALFRNLQPVFIFYYVALVEIPSERI